MWAREYFCATVGAVDEATIKAYIENQKWAEQASGGFSRTPRLSVAKDFTGFEPVVLNRFIK